MSVQSEFANDAGVDALGERYVQVLELLLRFSLATEQIVSFDR